MAGRKAAAARCRDFTLELPEQGAAMLDVLERLAGKWTILLLGALHGGRRRYGELQRAVPAIPQRALERTLRQAEREGLVERTAHRVFPPRVDYEITALGRGLLVQLHALQQWLIEHRAAMQAANARFDARA